MLHENDPIRQFRLAILSLIALVVLGTFGYNIIEGWPVVDSLYMTILTVGTVGYKEVHEITDNGGKFFTMALIVFGVAIVFWAGASLIESFIGEQMWHAIKRKKMQKQISKYRDHFIVCGFGRMGQQIVKDLQREQIPHVVIESNAEQLPRLIAQDIPFIEGNASDNRSLTAAGIEHARGLITVAPSDEDNVFITLSAKALNRGLFVVARSIQEENEDKLRMAGADRVMSPYTMGGKRMAAAAIRPNVVDFLDLASHDSEYQMMIEEITISDGAQLSGNAIGESGIKDKTGVTIIALKKTSGKVMANPEESEPLAPGDILIVLGKPDQLENAAKLAGQA